MGFTTSNLSLYHTFSKTPVDSNTNSAAAQLGNAINKSGHTVQSNEIWTESIPFFGLAATTTAIHNKFSATAKVNDLVKDSDGKIWQRNSTAYSASAKFADLWSEKTKSITSFTKGADGKYTFTEANEALADGSYLLNSDGIPTVKYYEKRLLTRLTADNNANTNSDNKASRLQIDGKWIDQFIGVTDIYLNGSAAVSYAPVLRKTNNDAPMQAGPGKGYMDYCATGLILWESSAAGTEVIDCFEYVGAKLDATVAKLNAAVFGSNNGGADQPVDLVTQVNQNTEAIRVLNSTDEADTGSIANSIKTAIDNLGDVAVKDDITITDIKVQIGADGAANSLTIDENKSVTITIPEISTVNSDNQLDINDHVIEVKTSIFTAETGTSTSIGTMTANENGLATGATVVAVANDALRAAKAYSNDLHTTSVTYHVTDTLPTVLAGKEEEYKGRIYLVLTGIDGVTAADGDRIEYMYVEENGVWGWEQIGTTTADLADYAKTADLNVTDIGSGAVKVSQVDGKVSSVTVETEALVSENAIKESTLSDTALITAADALVAIRLAKPENYVASVTGYTEKGAEVTTTQGTAVKVLDDRGTSVTADDLWGTTATMSEDGVLSISHDWVTNPNASKTIPWLINVTKVENNKAYVGDTFYANIQTERIKDGSYMFYNSNLSEFSSDLPSLMDGLSMFYGTQLTSFNGDLSSLVKGNDMFQVSQLKSFNGDLNSLVDGSNMFYGTQLTSFNGDLSSLVDSYGMFKGSQLNSFNGDLSSLVAGYAMFQDSQLNSFNGDLSSLVNGSIMFANTQLGMESLETICDTLPKKSDLKTWDDTEKAYKNWDENKDFEYLITKIDGNYKKAQLIYTIAKASVASITITYRNVPTDKETIDAIYDLFEKTANTKGWTIITNEELGGTHPVGVEMTDGTVQRYIYAIKHEADEKTATYVDGEGKYWTVDTAEAIIGPNVKYWSIFATVEDAITEWGLTPYAQA